MLWDVGSQWLHLFVSVSITFILTDTAVWCEMRVLPDRDSVMDWETLPADRELEVLQLWCGCWFTSAVLVYTCCLPGVSCPRVCITSPTSGSSSFYFSFTPIRVGVLSNRQLRGTLHRSVQDCWRQWDGDGVRRWGGTNMFYVLSNPLSCEGVRSWVEDTQSK